MKGISSNESKIVKYDPVCKWQTILSIYAISIELNKNIKTATFTWSVLVHEDLVSCS